MKWNSKDHKIPEYQEAYETEIVFDINLKGYPLRDFKNIYSEMSNLVKEYGKLNQRNKKKDDLHLYKHAMHLIRLLLMGTEILKGEPVRTFRKERNFLLDIRNEKYFFEQIFDIVVWSEHRRGYFPPGFYD